MKKISTLALALIAMGSLSMPASAQVKFEPVSTPTLESGWYQMRQVVGVTRKDISATAPRYVYSAETAKNGKYYFASDAAQKSDATAFVYVDNTDGKYAIKSINGKWGDFVAISSNTKPATYDITQVDKIIPHNIAWEQKVIGKIGRTGIILLAHKIVAMLVSSSLR